MVKLAHIREMHIPVLLKEVIEVLDPNPNENFIDATIGGGGHSMAILDKTAPNGKILGIDWNEEAIKLLSFQFGVGLGQGLQIENDRIKERLILVNDNFAHLEEIAQKYNFIDIDGVLFDLGFSSDEIENSGRGFSFLRNEALDMRYNKRVRFSASEAVNKLDEKNLSDIFWKFGEEKFSRQIAKAIIEKRKKNPILTTFNLVDAVKIVVSKKYWYRRIHPATKIFQALRIFVNDEFNNLKEALKTAVRITKPAGRIAIISFHSLEDRIVKDYFKELGREGKIKILTKKPIVPSPAEIKNNPRARSAKLRAAQIN